MNNKISFGRWSVLGLFIVYAAISVTLFAFSSGGWGALAMLMYGSVVFVALLIAFAAFVFIKFKIGERIEISKKLLWVTLGLQVLAIFLNVGDCGDAAGSYLFIQRLFVSGRVCDSIHLIGGGFFQIVPIIYLVSLTYTLFSSSKSNN